MHLLIIPDGNRRWAAARGLGASEGYRTAALTIPDMTERLFGDASVTYLTYWVLSVDNLAKRSKPEVGALMDLLAEYLERELKNPRYGEMGIRFRAVGLWRELLSETYPEVVRLLSSLEAETATNGRRFLTMLVAYDGYAEMLAAIRQLQREPATEPTDRTVHERSWTSFLPRVDGVIRTGVRGDPHGSGGVLMWLTGDSQYYFTETHFPDFTPAEAVAAARDIRERQRRFGG